MHYVHGYIPYLHKYLHLLYLEIGNYNLLNWAPSFLPRMEVHLVADMTGIFFPSLSNVQVQLLLNYRTTNSYIESNEKVQ